MLINQQRRHPFFYSIIEDLTIQLFFKIRQNIAHRILKRLPEKLVSAVLDHIELAVRDDLFGFLRVGERYGTVLVAMKEQHVPLIGREQLIEIHLPQIGDIVFPDMDPAAEQAYVFRNIVFCLILFSFAVVFCGQCRIHEDHARDLVLMCAADDGRDKSAHAAPEKNHLVRIDKIPGLGGRKDRFQIRRLGQNGHFPVAAVTSVAADCAAAEIKDICRIAGLS